MIKKRKHQLYFKQPQYTENIPLTKINFFPGVSIIQVEITPETDRDYGLIAGSEGLGSEFFADSQGNLYAIDLDMLPLEAIYVESMELFKPVKNIIKSAAKPGILTLENYPKNPINPYEILIGSLFGNAIFSFDELFIDSAERFFEQSQSLEFVQVGIGIIFGIHRQERNFQIVMIEDFNCIQIFSDMTFSQEKYGQKFMEVLDNLHLKFYEYPNNTILFDKFVNDTVISLTNLINKVPEWEKAIDAVNELGESYKKSLEYFLKICQQY